MLPHNYAFLFLLTCQALFSYSHAQEKRAPFSSWAGKRSASSPLIHSQLAEASEDLAKLVSDLRSLYLIEQHGLNAGDEGSAIKRAPFSSWAGKRAPFSSWAGKRAPFSSWAGKKRSSEEIEDDYESHRFKRSSDEDLEDEDEAGHLRERRGANSFSAWGGKRAAGLRRFARNAPVVRVLRPQRAAFSAWGG